MNCPECKKENVSDQAVACPSCGFGIKADAEKKQAAKGCFWIVFLVLMVGPAGPCSEDETKVPAMADGSSTSRPAGSVPANSSILDVPNANPFPHKLGKMRKVGFNNQDRYKLHVDLLPVDYLLTEATFDSLARYIVGHELKDPPQELFFQFFLPRNPEAAYATLDMRNARVREVIIMPSGTLGTLWDPERSKLKGMLLPGTTWTTIEGAPLYDPATDPIKISTAKSELSLENHGSFRIEEVIGGPDGGLLRIGAKSKDGTYIGKWLVRVSDLVPQYLHSLDR